MSMDYIPRISRIATLLADPKRSAMLWALIDGATRGADELANLAGLTPSSASAHLSQLSAAGLLKREARGRKRFFRLAAPEVGMAVEALASVPAVRNDAGRAPALLPGAAGATRKAGLCKDHLGGEVANALYKGFVEAGWIDVTPGGASLSPEGVLALAARGIYVQAFAQRGCLAVSTCCDWCNGQPHLSGVLGASLLQLFLQKGWVRRLDDGHALRVTRVGQQALTRWCQHAAADQTGQPSGNQAI
jgi:DNA-binding transcriptional ArsR family regulator